MVYSIDIVKNKIIFLLIIVIAFILRFYQLGSLPASLNWDEISHGYNAYSLLQTGQDQWGVSWPKFNFRAYGDYPTVANLYVTLPFISFFGLNSFAIRLPHAIFSLIFVILIYFLVLEITKDRFTAFFTMFLAAISPWTVFPSRGVFQSNLSLTFFTAGLLFILKSLKKPTLLPISLILFGTSLYSYHNTRIIVPIILVLIFIIFFKKFKKIFFHHRITFIFSLLIFLILYIPNLLNLFSSESAARNRWVGIINPASINQINESRHSFSGPPIFNRLINNKVFYFSKILAKNYLQLFNPLPLFFQGSQDYQFNPPRTGLIFLIFLPFFYHGLFLLIKNYPFYFSLFLISLLPAAITVGNFPSIRATCALPFYFLTISLSLKFFHRRLKIITPLICLGALIQLGFYINTYYQYNREYSSTWQYGYEQVVEFIKPLYSDYSRIIITKKYGEPHEFVLFYWPWDPQQYQTDIHKKWDFHADWYWVDAFDKFQFVNDWEIKDLQPLTSTLLITSPNNYPTKDAKLINTINFLNGQPAFEIISYE